MSIFARAIAYVCIGITVEVIFTALKALVERRDWRLQGYTQLYGILFYSLGGIFLLEPIHNALGGSLIILRFIIYGLMVFAVEYIAGTIIKRLTGQCPWEYTGRGNVKGFIYLPYFLLWGLLGILFELIHTYLIRL